MKRKRNNKLQKSNKRRKNDLHMPFIRDICSIVLNYLSLFQLYDMEKLYSKDVEYYLRNDTICNKIRSRYIIVCDLFRTMIIKDGVLYGWGENCSGQIKDTTDKKLYINQPNVMTKEVIDVTCCEDYTLILTKDNTLYGRGCNFMNYFGLDDPEHQLQMTKVKKDVIQVASGENHVMWLTKDNILYGYGSNSNGQLGLGHKNNVKQFTKITEHVKKVFCNTDCTFILTIDDVLYGCGSNEFGKLGIKNKTDVLDFMKIMDNIKSMSSHCCHTIILTKDNVLYGVGCNSGGELGLGHTKEVHEMTRLYIPCQGSSHDVVYTTCGPGITLVITRDGSLYGCGYELRKIINIKHEKTSRMIKLHENVVHVECNDSYIMIITKKGHLYTRGKGYNGQTGLGHEKHVLEWTKVMTLV
jgi:alpha-tubulin suppressor-like RCC1 family protein